jgi:small neutral amino acid transporter SnatA (MarC family)
VNPASLAIVAGLSVAMLVIFLATGQQLNLTITAVLVTGGIATLAVFFHGREEAREEANEGDSTDEPREAPAIAPSAEPPTPVQPEDTPTIDSD